MDYFQVNKKIHRAEHKWKFILLTLNGLGIRQTGYIHLHKNNRMNLKIVLFWKRDGTSQITLC